MAFELPCLLIKPLDINRFTHINRNTVRYKQAVSLGVAGSKLHLNNHSRDVLFYLYGARGHGFVH
jgi:hypothetical protein